MPLPQFYGVKSMYAKIFIQSPMERVHRFNSDGKKNISWKAAETVAASVLFPRMKGAKQ